MEKEREHENANGNEDSRVIDNIDDIDDKNKKADIKKLRGALGLARKAGAVVLGTEAVIEIIRRNKAVCVYMSSDVSENTKKKLSDKTSFYKAPIKRLPLTMSELADCVGYSSPAAAAAVTDKNFLILIGKYLREANENENENENEI